jgi:hypothetical protein
MEFTTNLYYHDIMRTAVIWDLTSCRLVGVYRHVKRILLPMSSGQGGSGIIRSISILLAGYMAPHPRRQQSSYEFKICSYALKVKYIQGYK